MAAALRFLILLTIASYSESVSLDDDGYRDLTVRIETHSDINGGGDCADVLDNLEVSHRSIIY